MTDPAPQDDHPVRTALDALVRTGVDWGWRTGPVPGARAPLPRQEVVGATGLTSAPATSRPAAVLVLLGEQHEALEVLLVERAASLNHHPGQIAFPGGRLDPDDRGPVDAALREAVEETGLDPSGVDVVGTLDGLPLPVSNHVVTPVLAWWADPSPVGVVDAGESAAVFRVSVADLLDPENRRLARVSRGGRSLDSPAFLVEGHLVWGFTGIVLDRVLDGLGWTRPWEPRVLDIPV